MNNYLDRTISLLGEEHVKNLQDKTILVVGLGGVGGTALEALARSGFMNFIIIDSDDVDASNLNRQIMYLSSDIGCSKVDVCEKRIKAINENIKVSKYKTFLDAKFLEKLSDTKIDYVVDAIDSVDSKISLYEFCLSRNIQFISSLGMGKRIDPTKICVMSLNKTEGDPLARKIRYECKRRSLNLKSINVVCSKEHPINNDITISSMMMVPSSAGLLIAKEVICYFK